MKKLLLLVESPFSKRDYDRFGVPLLESFFSVEVFDITAWSRPEFWEKYADIAFSYKGRRVFDAYEPLRDALTSGGYDFVVDYLSPGSKVSPIHQLLKELEIPRCIVAAGFLPAPRSSAFDRICALKYRTKRLKLLWEAFRGVLSRRTNSVAPDYALLAGSASAALLGAQTRPIWAHSLDYDIHMGMRGQPRPGQSYAVYADEDLAFHSDLVALHIKPMVTPEKFYPALTGFFDRFEKQTGLKVVIAAHPRSRWDLRRSLLGGREAVYGKTAELMSGASLVFSHASTSIGFAVLSEVPLVLLTSDELNNSFYRDEIAVRHKFFGVRLINIDHVEPRDFDLEALQHLHKTEYCEYREKYIKTAGSPELPSWEIFARAVLTDLETGTKPPSRL